MKKIFDSVVEMVGHTPLLKMNNVMKKLKLKANILAKCEAYNPAFSIKDRVALKMIEEAEKSHKISSDTVFVEATSGNTGIGLAAICAAKGYKLVITMPENMSVERIKLMSLFGAEIILTPAEDGMSGAIKKAEILAEKNKNVIMLKQFSNPANPNAHKLGTSMEIMEQTGGNVDALVCAVGTSGTLTGIASALKSCNPDLFVAAVDEVFDVADDEAAAMIKFCAETEGLAIGVSAGAALAAAISLADRNEFKHKNIVVILPDAYERYMSMDLF